jgi:ribosomal protein S18 acetylase RimI-like enzyme
MNRMALGMSLEAKRHGITVVALNPGFMRTERVQMHLKSRLRGKTVMTFRVAQEGDVGAVIHLMRDYYAEEGYPFVEAEARATVTRLLRDGQLGRAWLACAGEAPIAYLAVTFGYSFEYRGRDAFIDELYILPAHRRRGLGAEALALAEAACREAGVRALHLEVERSKAAAQALYRRWGFADHDRCLMTKRLDPPMPAEGQPRAGS